MCRHRTPCPDADGDARDLAAVVRSHPEQGWRLLCNGVVLFDDDRAPDDSLGSGPRRGDRQTAPPEGSQGRSHAVGAEIFPVPPWAVCSRTSASANASGGGQEQTRLRSP